MVPIIISAITLINRKNTNGSLLIGEKCILLKRLAIMAMSMKNWLLNPVMNMFVKKILNIQTTGVTIAMNGVKRLLMNIAWVTASRLQCRSLKTKTSANRPSTKSVATTVLPMRETILLAGPRNGCTTVILPTKAQETASSCS